MEEMLVYYLSGSVAIGLIMEILVKVDALFDSWSLAKKFKVFGFSLSWMQVLGFLLSLGTSAVLTVQGNLYWAYALAGAVGIYFTEFGAGKAGWRKIFEILYSIAKGLSKK